MEKKIDQIVQNKQDKTVNDFLQLFGKEGSNGSDIDCGKWDFKIIEESISQPRVISSATYPNVIFYRKKVFYTFDGRTLYFDTMSKAPFIFLPYPIKDILYYNCEGNKYFVTLDTTNKLQYSLYDGHKLAKNRFTLCRNVVQMIKHKNDIYFLSNKKDKHYVFKIQSEKEGLKPKVLLHNVAVKNTLSLYSALDNLFMFKDGILHSIDNKIISLDKNVQDRESGTKGSSIIGDGIVAIDDKYLVYQRSVEAVVFNLYDQKFTFLNRIVIPSTSRNLKTISLNEVVCVRLGKVFYFLQVGSEGVYIGKKMEQTDYPFEFDARKNNKCIYMVKLVSGDSNSENESFAGSSKGAIIGALSDFPSKVNVDQSENEVKIARPNEDSKVYDPNVYGADETKTENCINNPHIKPNQSFSYLESPEKVHIDKLFDKNVLTQSIRTNTTVDRSPGKQRNKNSDTLNKIAEIKNDNDENLDTIKGMIKSEIDRSFKNYSNVFDKKIQDLICQYLDKKLNLLCDSLNSKTEHIMQKTVETLYSNNTQVFEQKALALIKEILVNTLLPVVEASMDEMRIQVIKEVKLMNNDDHIQDIKKAIQHIGLSQTFASDIKNYLKEGDVRTAADLTIKNGEKELETFIQNVDFNDLDALSQDVLLALLEKATVNSKEGIDGIYSRFMNNIISVIELNTLSQDEMSCFSLILNTITELPGIEDNSNTGLVILIDFLKGKIARIQKRKKLMYDSQSYK